MSDDVKLEPEWEREKLAKQEAGRQPPPKPPRKIIGALIAAVLMIGTGVAIYAVVRRSPAQTDSAASTTKVRIEVRGNQVMTIRKDGKVMGTVPLSFIVPKSTTPITLEARWTERRYAPTGASKDFPRLEVQTIVPDKDKTVDFNRINGKRDDTTE